jgi:hypothetical protein
MDERILEQLSQPFKVSERRGVGNKVFKYVPTEDIVDRMNKAFRGNWSTEVQNSEVIEDQVLMCVRVYVQDPTNDNAKVQWHDGYASHPLTRYTSGPNNGKIIDVGNSYKSAMSKAIKTAVAKWGVALYLEQESSQPTPAAAPIQTPVATSPIPVEPKKETTVAGPPMSGPPTESPTKPASGSPSGPPAGPPVGPPVGNPGGGPSTSQPPVFTVDNTEAPLKDGGLEIPTGLDGGGGEKLTPVQKVAIETIMSVNNMTFDDLLAKSLLREDNLPQSIEDISYLDAVTIIQYGNNLRL